MANINSSIAWFRDRLGQVSYSMTYRNGPYSFDCSSAVYYALIQGGFFPTGIYIGNTDSLYRDLEKYGWTQLQPNAQGNYDTQAGDVFLWGKRGASGGAAGHTGEFTSADDVIHCNYGSDDITLNNYDWLREINGYPEQTFYRYTGSGAVPSNPVDQILEVGSVIQFSKVYRADDVQVHEGIWQVQTAELCREGFTWEDNGIPAEIVVEVDVQGYATRDQELDVGTLYMIPGKYTVLDTGESNGMWLAQVEAAGVRFWVDMETLTEISSTDPGKAAPAVKPLPPVIPEVPPVATPPVIAPAPVLPVPTPTPDPVVVPPAPSPTKDEEQDVKIGGIMELLRAIGELFVKFLAKFKK